MNNHFLLHSDTAVALYECVRSLPILDFHNHISVADVATDRRYQNLYELWIASDPYKHRLMRICGIPERFITGDAEPYEKFQKFCSVFPYLAGNPVYDWSRMELSCVFGIEELPSETSAARIWERANEMLASDGFSTRGILSRFSIEYQSPVAQIDDDLSVFCGGATAPSLRADSLLSPSEELKAWLRDTTGIAPDSEDAYIRAVSVVLNRFDAAGCRFADHSLDAGFFEDDTDGLVVKRLAALAAEYKKRGWTLLLHVGAKRKTSPRLARLAGPAGGYAASGGGFPIETLTDLLGKMEDAGGLPDTVFFPLNMNDQAPMAILQGSFSEDMTPSKVQLGPAWWWCDHALGIENTLSAIASFGVLSQFIGMTTDSRSILSFVRHDYFRRILCSFLAKQNDGGWDLPFETLAELAKKICYYNAKDKINGK